MTATFDSKTIMSMNIMSLSSPNGFVAVGPDRFGVASFDNLRILRADRNTAVETVPPRYHDLKFLPKTKMNKNSVGREYVDLLKEPGNKQQL